MTSETSLFEVSDQVVVITGGTSGLGRAIAEGFLEAGATVIVASRRPDLHPPIARDGRAAVSMPMDVADRDSIHALANAVVSRHGCIDTLVNSAGIGGRSAAEACSPEMWSTVVEVNLTGTFNCCQIIGNVMLEAASGAIVNIASIAGMVGIPGSAPYQASKGGVVQLTRSLAVEWASRGVRVNAIAPSQFATPLVRRQWEAEPDMRDNFVARTPIGRIGDPREIVGPAIFLASDAASMITGHILTVDGGYTAQ